MTQQYVQPTGQQQQWTTGQSQQFSGVDGGTLPQQYRQGLDSVAQAIQVCGWCADQCIQTADPNMTECIRLCEDVVELGETVLALVPRTSRFTSDIVQTFTQAAQMCAQECGQHQHSHCQECATVLDQTTQAVQQLSGMGSQGMGSQTSQGMSSQFGQGMGSQTGQEMFGQQQW